MKGSIICILTLFLFSACKAKNKQVHVWEKLEIELTAINDFKNPYTDVAIWVDLKGPNFEKRVYGFWDGDHTFRVRVLATKAGDWSWVSGSNTTDTGINGKKGTFTAIDWTTNEKQENPNRRGFLRPTPNGHALQYNDGFPFFLLADTWWAAATWRLPMKSKPVSDQYTPTPDIGFEEAIQFNKRRGYNGFAMIASFPNWHNDGYPAHIEDSDGITIRSCKTWKDNQTGNAKDMSCQKGFRPFEFPGKSPSLGEICADFDQINPSYFQSLDKKMEYSAQEGFVVFLETIRRDHFPSWRAYHDFNTSFVRYIQYVAARYGCYNILFSLAHQDAGMYNITEALNLWFKTYGGLPFEQPTTALAAKSTYELYGHKEVVPWLTLHGIGNHPPRMNVALPYMEELFKLSPAVPAITQEPYYPGTKADWHLPKGVRVPETDSPRDQYFARTQAYGGVLSGGLGGHIYGTNAWDGDAAAHEPRSENFGEGNDYFYEALQFKSASQMSYMQKFMLSEDAKFQDMILATDDFHPRSSTENALEHSFSGLTFMMRTPDKKLSMLYFEEKCKAPVLKNMISNALYQAYWFNPRNGKWHNKKSVLKSDSAGILKIPAFPGNITETEKNKDWALKLVQL